MVAEAPSETQLLQFECGNCHAQLCVPESFAGVSGPCPHCSHTITAPAKRELALIESVPAPKLTEATKSLLPNETMAAAEENDISLSVEAEEEAEIETDELTQPQRISLFERRGFRPVRMILATAATLVIFFSFQALKTRRWIWQHPAEENVAEKTPVPPKEPASVTPVAPEAEGIKPPSLPNLHALSADSR